MSYAEPELLFHKYDMHGLMQNHIEQASAASSSINDDKLLNTPTEDLLEQIYQQYSFNIPVLDRDNATADPKEGPVEVQDSYFSRDYRGGTPGRHTVQGTIVDLSVPYTGDKDFFYVRPTTFDSAPPRANVERGQIRLTYKSRELNAEQANKSLNQVLDVIEKYLKWLRDTAGPFNEQLKPSIRSAIEARKAKVLKNRNSAASLGFKLKHRPDAPKTYVAPVTRKKIMPATPPRHGSEPYKPEPVLDEATYQDILRIIESMSHVMERSPSAFEGMGEESLRQHFLVQLNGQYEGAASGETFNFKGKTDILIREKDRNIFIAECKFWGGPKAFLETIDQLLGYLSWRDTKAAVIIFSRNKDFSNVVASIQETALAHPHKKHGPDPQGESRFRYVFGNPSDHNREIILTVMAFNIPVG